MDYIAYLCDRVCVPGPQLAPKPSSEHSDHASQPASQPDFEWFVDFFEWFVLKNVFLNGLLIFFDTL